jgi:hypothetical protein
MQNSPEKFSETYRNCSDSEIATLHAQMNSLTENARAALASEIERRGMNSAQLPKLYASELRKETKFDERQKEHRRIVASFLLRGDPKWTMILILALIAVVALCALISFHH